MIASQASTGQSSQHPCSRRHHLQRPFIDKMRSTSSTQPSFCDASLVKSCMEKSDHYSFNPTLASWHDNKEKTINQSLIDMVDMD